MARSITLAWIAAACAVAAACATQSSTPAPKTVKKTASVATSTSTPPVTKSAESVKASTPPGAKAAQPVTFSGCLQARGAKYVLTDPKGKAAPTRRSWKTAFIKKTPKDIEVVSASSTLKLKDHVGHQITVTGVQDNAVHVTARSVKRLAASCS